VTRARAAVADGCGGFAVEEIEVGDPGAGEVRVRLAASGICHTDLDLMREASAPLVLGHEGAGTVEQVGPGVTEVVEGDCVLLQWANPCGQCFQCVRGLFVHCERRGWTTGGHAHAEATCRNGDRLSRAFNLGTLSETTVVQSTAVVKIEGRIPMSSACLLGCGVMTGYGSVVNAARVRPGTSVVVLGTGGVGLNVVQAARICGAAMIIAVDLTLERLETARRFGATHLVEADAADTGLGEVAARVRGLTEGRGADYAFECTAVPELGAAPLAMIRHGGTAIQVSGVEQTIPVDMRLFEWDKTYLNPLYGQCRPAIDFPLLLALYASGELLLDELVTRTYVIDQLPDAFDDLVAGRNAKGVVLFDAT
jgi:S-(hydroxymethyl)glutathione dehydrogenase/alcohol dehydrogenase